MDYQLAKAANAHFSLVDLLSKHFQVNARPGSTMLCPFHHDGRKSAKLYPDNALYCFTESKMYRPYDLLRHVGYTDVQIRGMFPFSQLPPEEEKAPILADPSPVRIFFRTTGNLASTLGNYYTGYGRKRSG